MRYIRNYSKSATLHADHSFYNVTGKRDDGVEVSSRIFAKDAEQAESKMQAAHMWELTDVVVTK